MHDHLVIYIINQYISDKEVPKNVTVDAIVTDDRVWQFTYALAAIETRGTGIIQGSVAGL